MEIAINLGSIALDGIEGIKQLCARANTGNYDSFQFPVDTFYKVPAGKTLLITELCYYSNATSIILRIGYGDSSVSDSGSAPTNNKDVIEWLPCAEAYKPYKTNINIYIPELKYPYCRSNNGAIGVSIRGVEL